MFSMRLTCRELDGGLEALKPEASVFRSLGALESLGSPERCLTGELSES